MPRSLTSDQIRSDFLDFWREFGSTVLPSASLVPYDDPTVLFTIAGMQPLVPYFMGTVQPPYTRYASIQKCFRTNDIDEVGDPRHCTFFEMMGNFSLGDYFKQDAIGLAYEFVTRHLELEPERLWITVHESDDEAEQIWRRVGIPAERIVRLGDADNWWGPPGRSGPCGPDTEIYYQQDPGHGCGFPHDPEGCDCGRLEFWNLVFTQFFQDENGVRTPLPKKNVDTGIGLEHTSALVQRTPSVYETDLYLPIIQQAAQLAGRLYGQGPEVDYALRVLADHGRAMTFLVGDGVIPGTGGRDYVLRRIIRRAVRYGRRLGVDRPFLAELAEAVITRMEGHYPELRERQALIKQILGNEEELFLRTLQAGTAQVERLVQEARRAGLTTIPGARVFDLYQTYGFPPELTEEALREEGLSYDQTGYQQALEEERQRAKEAATFGQAERGGGSGEFAALPETEFLAWSSTRHQARVLGLRTDGAAPDALRAGQTGRLVLEASPFYPEGGGQVGDTGVLRTGSGLFVVEDTQIDGSGHIVHIGHVEEGSVAANELATAEVDLQRRGRSMRHHTVTHLLHRALKDVLGEGTSQQGSLVSPELARFDFNYPRAMTPEQLWDVAQIVNDRSMQDLPVHWEIMDIEAARRSGAVMMFGEKYGERVRVVSIGEYSKELCGGTHTHHSGELGLAVIASESGIGSGKRRIVAYAGEAALAYYADRLRLLEDLSHRLGASNVDDAAQRLEALLEQQEQARRELERLQQQRAHEEAHSLVDSAKDVQGVKLVAQRVDADEATLKRLIDVSRQGLKSGVVVLGGVHDGRVRLFAGATPDLAGKKVHAGNLLREVAKAAGGGGGGRPDFAGPGGGDPGKLGAALQQVPALLEAQLRG